MNRLYKIGTYRFDEEGMERIYNTLYELRRYFVYDIERYVALSACMEEVAGRSKRLKTLAEQAERVRHG